MNSPKNTIQGLQVLRAIAAVLVVVEHSELAAEKMSSIYRATPFAWGIGVDIFFVVSGIVMVYTQHEKFSKNGSVLSFMIRRMIRIIPLYYIYTLLLVATAALGLADNHITALNLILSFLFIPHTSESGLIRPVLELGWTLNYEMLFYAFFSLCLFFRRNSGLALLFSILCAVVLFGAWREFDSSALLFWSNPLILEFSFGVLIGLAIRKSDFFQHWSASIALIALSATLYLLLSHGVPEDSGVFRLVSRGLPAALFCLAFVHMRGTDNKAWQIATYIGDSSYSLYLSHPFVLAALATFWKLWPGGGGGVYVGISVAMCILFGICSYRLLENPITNGLSRKIAL